MTATLFELPAEIRSHPAKYTDALLYTFVEMLRGCQRVLDPFVGTGKIFLVNRWLPELVIHGVEIEPEWAKANSGTIVGNALHLPYADNSFNAICTSPAYGNRMADKLLPGKRVTYANKLGRELHKDNSGGLQWGNKYKEFHLMAWRECRRVLDNSGMLILNIKDHVRNYKVQPVTDWHIETLQALGFVVIEHIDINCPGMRYGQNYELRVDCESVIKLEVEA